MTTIPSNTPLRSLARILHAAATVGPGAWDGGDQQSNGDPPSESTLANDLHALFALLRDRNVPYLLVGGVAMLRYIAGRNTDDIDLIMAVEDAARLPEIIIEDSQHDAAKARFRSVRLDLRLTRNAIFRLAIERYATTHHFAEAPVPCATVEGLVLLKMYALPSLYRQGDLQRAALYETDITMLCQQHRPNLAPLLDILRQHLAPGELDELQRIINEIEQRLRRMQRRSTER